MLSRSFGNPPPYRSELKLSSCPQNNNTCVEERCYQPEYTCCPENEFQHFYKCTSPPGIIKIMSFLIIILCIGLFVAVVCTLSWDLNFYGSSSMTSGIGFPGHLGSGFASSYGYGSSSTRGGYMDQWAAKVFILAVAAFCFIIAVAIFILCLVNPCMCQTGRYYVCLIIISCILCFLLLIAGIVYVLAVSPYITASGSVFYTQICALCIEYFSSTNSGIYVYLYWYHYCILDIEEIISIVLVCLIILALIAIIILALITRNRICCCGKRNIMWYRRQVCEPAPKIEEWPKNTKTGCSEIVPVLDYQDQLPTSMTHPVYQKANERKGYTDNTYKYSQDHFELIKDVKPSDYFSKTTYIGSTKRLPQKIRAERSNIDNYDMDYTTAGESCDELDIKEEWGREYPPITSDEQRQAYKKDFDAELQEYRGLQAELEEIKEELRYLDKELDEYNEDTEEYKAAAEEYNRLKDIKASADYTYKKAQFKKLKNKLSHIKKMVNDYDNQKP
ncbi:PREDICTED: occludin [Gavialis gangeticus]|uniref:occludin n=1 Tax=Gavialis gangeticus TaxID=94835 RepID=UPI00092EEA76|nr:PREDICTED: occludin [Gavialis gangeticus]